MIRSDLALAALCVLSCASGCATVINGTKQTIPIRSNPPGATARVLPANVVVTTPAEVELERKKAHTVRIELEGYCRESTYIDRTTSEALAGNILLGGLIGMSVDASNGAAFDLKPCGVDVTLRRADGVHTFPQCDVPAKPIAAEAPPAPNRAGD